MDEEVTASEIAAGRITVAYINGKGVKRAGSAIIGNVNAEAGLGFADLGGPIKVRLIPIESQAEDFIRPEG